MTTQATYNKRLLKLADYLETVPRRKFDYTSLSIPDRGSFRTWPTPSKSTRTTACALGHAAMMPQFRRLGMRVQCNYKDYLGNPEFDVVMLDGSDPIDVVFGPDSYALFTPDVGEYNATPKQVAKKIRDYVKANS